MAFINRIVKKSVSFVLNARKRVVGRKLLLTLDDKQLSDIGLTRMQAIEEAKKTFWK